MLPFLPILTLPSTVCTQQKDHGHWHRRMDCNHAGGIVHAVLRLSDCHEKLLFPFLHELTIGNNPKLVFSFSVFFLAYQTTGFGGIGEASYSALGPAIIGDLFVGNTRSKMLALFYLTAIFGRYCPTFNIFLVK